MKKIILDTNFLLSSHQFKIDVLRLIDEAASFRYELCVLDKTIDELQRIISAQTGKNRDAAKWGLSLVQNNDITLISTDVGNVDDLLVKYGAAGDIVATQDQELKQRLLTAGATIAILRQKKQVVFINEKPE